MQYLVTSEFIDPMGNGLYNPPADTARLLEQLVLPGLQAMGKLAKEGKILAGGILSGERASAFIVEAASNDELTEMLQGLPLWITNKWKATPLESFEHHAEFVKKIAERLKSA